MRIRITMTEEVEYCHDYEPEEIAELLDIDAVGMSPEEVLRAVQAKVGTVEADGSGLLDDILDHFYAVPERDWGAEEAG